MPDAQVFISYSHRDAIWKDRLLTQLRPLEKAGKVSVWDDGKIGAGSDWSLQIRATLSKARVAILIITADFLGSDFILTEEVPRILQRRAGEGLHVIPLLAKACNWPMVPWLAEMQIRPLGGKELAALTAARRDTQLTAVAAEVMKLIETPLRSAARPTAPVEFEIASLEEHVDNFFAGNPTISTLEGVVLNSGRFLERYRELASGSGRRIDHVRFIVPSNDAIRAAYKRKPKHQAMYLTDTVSQIESAWQHLVDEGSVSTAEFRRIDCVPRNLCVIRNDDLVLTGLYEPDRSHPLGFTCLRSWFHASNGASKDVYDSYQLWFRSLWSEATRNP